MDSRKFATVSHTKTKFRQSNFGGRENRIPNCIYLCLFWKVRSGRNLSLKEMETYPKPQHTQASTIYVRKEPLSERDGNS
ncbi:hypothetical protein [Fervidobacterium gondwanense]|uniref:hypothetical protein n=1 Tax=Fervidobacterium gondwanense TaxID=44754 RepID=UPI003C770720